MVRRRFLPLVAATLAILSATIAAGDESPSIAEDEILPPAPTGVTLLSETTRLTAYNQFGHGFQSKAGPVLGPGTERLTVFEPQVEIVAAQGDRVTHRLWVPVDVMTEASPQVLPPPPDVVSGASRKNVAGNIEWATTVTTRRDAVFTVASGLHLEPPFRSWNGGFETARAFADQNTVVSGAVTGIFDWFDHFEVTGKRDGRNERSTTMGSAAFTQVLSPTTIANVNYGVTLQVGELSNTWNGVPLTTDVRGPEILPNERVRHALVGRLAQWLPWNGALRLYYRFYADDWGIVAHSAEAQLMQRLTPTFYLGAIYRFHTQTSPPFFTTLASPSATLRTSDSDLAALQSTTVGGKAVGDVPVRAGAIRAVHYELEYDRYVRTNDLQMDIVTCALGFRFF